MHLTLTDDPDPALRDAVLAPLEAYNARMTGRDDVLRPLGIFVRGADGGVTGGLAAVSYYDWMFVDLLYLPPNLRQAGLGTRLIAAAEREAIARGCRGIWLDTMSYQAPGFYARMGFAAFAEIADYSPGTRRMWFHKTPLAGARPDAAGGGGVASELLVTEAPDESARTVLRQGLIAHNDALDGPAQRRPIAVLIRETSEGPIVGGLHGHSGRGWMFVDLFCVPEAYRRHGLGTRVLGMAEEEARARGLRGVWLDTFTFQARPFYERLGYRVIGTIPDYPTGHARHFLAKRIDGEPLRPEPAIRVGRQTEGIVHAE